MARGGPSTDSGKAVVSLNAVRHGITSARVAIPSLEREEDWLAFREHFIEALAPEGALEEDLAEHVAATAWRRRRIPLHEAQMIAVGLERVPQEFARLAAWRDAPRTGEEARDTLDRTRAAAALLEGLDALPERRRLNARACHELIDAACASDDDVLEDLPGMPPPEHLSSGELWDATRLRSVLGEVAARLSIGLPELIAATAARLDDGISRRERDVAFTGDELDRMGRERSLPGAKELKSIARYETHLDRQYYRALHELQELQARRRGDPPLRAQVEVHGLPGS